MGKKLSLSVLALLLLSVLMLSVSCKTATTDDTLGTVDSTRIGEEGEPIVPEEPEVVYTLSFEQLPEKVHSGEYFTVVWKVDATPPFTITSTNLFYGPEPTAKEYGADTTKDETDYESMDKTFTQGSFDVPRTFTTKIQAPESGFMYVKAHAYAGGKNYWTEEKELEIDDTQKLSCSGVYKFVDGVCCLDIDVPVGECDIQEEQTEEVPETTEPETPAVTEPETPPTPTEEDLALEELRTRHPGTQESKLTVMTPILYKNILKLEMFYKIKAGDAPFSGGMCTADLFGKYPYNVIPWQSEQRSFWKQVLTDKLPKGENQVVIECYDPLGKYQAQRAVVTVTIP